MLQYTTVTYIVTFCLIRSTSWGKVACQKDGKDVRLASRRTAFTLSYLTVTQKLYLHTAFNMAPRSLKLNAAAETMNSDVPLTMM